MSLNNFRRSGRQWLSLFAFGALANHIGSFAGDSNRPDVNATFLQTESTYD
jgi:hypothetical protein